MELNLHFFDVSFFWPILVGTENRFEFWERTKNVKYEAKYLKKYYLV